MTEWNDARYELAERKRMDARNVEAEQARLRRQADEEQEDAEVAGVQPLIDAIRLTSQKKLTRHATIAVIRALSCHVAGCNWQDQDAIDLTCGVLDDLSDDLEAP